MPIEDAYLNEFRATKIDFTPRSRDLELATLCRSTASINVCSEDQGLSLSVAKALSLGCRLIASLIPAHSEQITDPRLVFAAEAGDDFMLAATYGLSKGQIAFHQSGAHSSNDDVSEMIMFGIFVNNSI